jgi:hypothetical protein
MAASCQSIHEKCMTKTNIDIKVSKYREVNLYKSKKLSYHKIWVKIDTLEVTPPCPVSVIKLSHINYTRMVALAFRVLIPLWKEETVCPPMGITTFDKTFAI